MFSGLPAPWTQALEAGNIEEVERLLGEYGDTKNEVGQTALMLAAQSSLTKVVAAILPRSISMVDNNGKTALHYAVEGHNTDILEIFMRKAWLQMDENGMTPIEYAIECRNAEALSFFLHHKLLLRDNLEATRLFATECGSQEIIRLLNEYEPLDSSPSVKSAPSVSKHVSKKTVSSNVKRLISEVREAFISHSETIDDLIEELLKEAAVTSSLGEILASLYKKRTKAFKVDIATKKKTAQKLTEDVNSGIASLATLMAEVERLQQEVRAPVDLIEASTDAPEEPETADRGLQLSQIAACEGCSAQQVEVDRLNLALAEASRSLQRAMSEHDEAIAQLQQKNSDQRSTISDLTKKLATREVVSYNKEVSTDEPRDSIAIGQYIAHITEELQRTRDDLYKTSEKLEKTPEGADELIQRVQGIQRAGDELSSHQVIESLFSTLCLSLVELLKERHISKMAISDKDYLENAIRNLHLTAHVTNHQEMRPDLAPADATDTADANSTAINLEPKDTEPLDDAEALGRSICSSVAANQPGEKADVDKYTASFVHSAIREASSASSFTSDNLAKLPHVNNDNTSRTPSHNSSSTLSFVSFKSYSSNGSTQSAPGGTRHTLVYKDKTSNVKTIIDQMIEISCSGIAKEREISKFSLPPHYKGLAASASASQKSIDTDMFASMSARKTTTKSSYIMKAPGDPQSLFGKRSAELNKSGGAPMRPAYESPQISDGCSPVKTIVADMSNSWIRYSSPLNKYNPTVMKNKSPYEYYSIVLNKSRSISTPLARSAGPDYAE